MTQTAEQFVWVRRQWNDYRQARYRLADLEGVHWSTVSGGVSAPAPQPFLHGYVWCNALLEGELAHSCQHGEGPHRIKVCIIKGANDSAVFAALAAQAGPKPDVREQAIRLKTALAEMNLQTQQAQAQGQGQTIAAIVAHVEAGAVPDAAKGRRMGITASVLAQWDLFAAAYAAALPKERAKQLRVKRMWETHPEWHHGAWSERKIAESCGVSHTTVQAAMKRYEISGKGLPDKSDAPQAPTPEAPTPPAPVSPTEPTKTPAPTVTVTRTSKLGKVHEYPQRQPARKTSARPAETETEQEEMAADVAPAPSHLLLSWHSLCLPRGVVKRVPRQPPTPMLPRPLPRPRPPQKPPPARKRGPCSVARSPRSLPSMAQARRPRRPRTPSPPMPPKMQTCS